jgi:hypothetical protein
MCSASVPYGRYGFAKCRLRAVDGLPHVRVRARSFRGEESLQDHGFIVLLIFGAVYQRDSAFRSLSS